MTDIIIIFCTSMLGFLLGCKWEKRQTSKENLYVDLLDFTIKFRANVLANKVVLDTFLQEFNKSCCKDFADLSNYFLYGKTAKLKQLKGNEYNYVKKFFAGLNAQNNKELLDHLDLFCNYFSSALSQLQAENKSKGKLGQKLGLLCGVIVGLVLI